MSASKTTNLKMHSWAASDAVVRTEFNDNFNLIDSAVGTINSTIGGLSSKFGTCLIFSGQYTGTGTATHTLTFDKLPQIIAFQTQSSTTLHMSIVQNKGYITGISSSSYVTVSGNKITFENLSTTAQSLNAPNTVYKYIAFCEVN